MPDLTRNLNLYFEAVEGLNPDVRARFDVSLIGALSGCTSQADWDRALEIVRKRLAALGYTPKLPT